MRETHCDRKSQQKSIRTCVGDHKIMSTAESPSGVEELQIVVFDTFMEESKTAMLPPAPLAEVVAPAEIISEVKHAADVTYQVLAPTEMTREVEHADMSSDANTSVVVEVTPEEKIVAIPTFTLFGKLGVGKTTLFNKITGARYETGSREQSVTQYTVSQKTINREMFIIDTPGQDAHKDVIKHANEIVAALECIPLNGIIIVEEIARVGTLSHRIQSSMDILGSNQHLASVIVTKTETMEDYDTEVATNELSRLLEMDRNRFLFVGKATDPHTIVAFLQDRILPSQVIELTEEQKQMLIVLSVPAKKCHEDLNELDEKFHAARQYIDGLFRCQKTNSIILNLTTWLIDFRDAEKQRLFRSIEREDDEQKITIYGKINVRLNNGLDNLIEFLNQKLSYYSKITSQHEYKACPHCKKVWVRAEGCDGRTNCGYRPSYASDDQECPFMGFQFQFCKIDNKWMLSVDDDNYTDYDRKVGYNRKFGYNGNTEEMHGYNFGTGCGQSISWYSMVPVSDDIFTAFKKEILQVQAKGRRVLIEKRVAKLWQAFPDYVNETKRRLRSQVYSLGALKTLCIRDEAVTVHHTSE